MSKQCKVAEIPLLRLKPALVEFHQKGLLRVLKPHESRMRAQGLVFACPRCSHDKQKAHFCIFIFDLHGVDPAWKPVPRFSPSYVLEKDKETGAENPVPVCFDAMSLTMVLPSGELHPWLTPGDLKCKWEGTVTNGVVRYRTTLFERWFN